MLKTHVNQNLITNCKINADDINRAEIVYVPSEPHIEGHMVRKKPHIHEKIEKVPLPPMISTHHLNLALGTDFFFVNGNIFLHTKSQKVNFLTFKHCTSRSLRTIITALEKVMHQYDCRGFNITDMHADKEFDKTELKHFCSLHCYIFMEEKNILGSLRGLCGQSKNDSGPHVVQCHSVGLQCLWSDPSLKE